MPCSATTVTQTHLYDGVKNSLRRISPDNDATRVSKYIPRALATTIPRPVLYYNYDVGESSDLIFGVSLVDYATSRGLADGEVPKIMRICIEEVDKRGLECEGIYRVSGRHAHVIEVRFASFS